MPSGALIGSHVHWSNDLVMQIFVLSGLYGDLIEDKPQKHVHTLHLL